MAAAVAHTHRVARTYHMDIKPGNFLIDENDNLVLGDWEQTDAPATTLAPEADGTWDVEEAAKNEDSAAPSCDERPRPQLLYTKYSGPPRRNVDDELGDYSWHSWNVFPVWNLAHPLALELAEVFSLGGSMWMLLRQPGMDFETSVTRTSLLPIGKHLRTYRSAGEKWLIAACRRIQTNGLTW